MPVVKIKHTLLNLRPRKLLLSPSNLSRNLFGNRGHLDTILEGFLIRHDGASNGVVVCDCAVNVVKREKEEGGKEREKVAVEKERKSLELPRVALAVWGHVGMKLLDAVKCTIETDA